MTSIEWTQPGGEAFERVQLAGSFSQWQPVDMVKSFEKWTIKLDLLPGEYEFKFVLDGNWVHDKGQPSKMNEMGTWNNIIVVSETTAAEDRENSPSGMSISSSIETIEDVSEEGWEIIEQPKKLNDSPITPTIEIERKFNVPNNYHEKLSAFGFKMLKDFDEVLVDRYFDNHEHSLIHGDFWLRQRNGDWELKYPVGSGHTEQGSTLYHETSNVDDIISKLRPILNLSQEEHNSLTLPQMIQQCKLESFAHIETKRKSYQYQDVNVVIDTTDWGHNVGEIEIILTDPSMIGEATEKLEKLAADLDFAPLDLSLNLAE